MDHGVTLHLLFDSCMVIFRIVTVSPTDTVLTAAKKMLEYRISSAVVTVENKPRGILT